MSVPDYKPFPVDALGLTLAKFVREASESIDVDPAFIAAPALAVVGAAIGNVYRIQLKPDWQEPAVIWSVIVGNSSTRKTPAFDAVMKPVQELQSSYHDDYIRDCEAHNQSEGEEPPPQLAHVMTNDSTIEQLAAMLHTSPQGILFARDELSNWFDSFTRYQRRSTADWLELAKCGFLKIDRKTGDPRTLIVKNASACVTGGIQPAVLRKILSEEFFVNGMAARLLFAYPPKRKRQDAEVFIGDEARNGYEVLVRTLYSRSRKRTTTTSILMDKEAKSQWRKFVRETSDRQFEAEDDEAAAIGKLEAYAARFALIRHCADRAAELDSNPGEVNAVAINAGIEIASWFEGEMKRIYAMLRETPEDKTVRDLCEYIAGKGGHITARDLAHNRKTRFKTSDEATKALTGLVEKGRGKWEYLPSGPEGGRPSATFVLANGTLRRYDETPGNIEESKVSS